jgi:outer membrane lipoprotein-sorting protein
MVSRKPLLALGIVVLVAAASVGGYASTGTASLQDSPNEETPSEETIEEHAIGNNTTVESITGTVVIKTEIGETTRTMKAKIWQEPPNKLRLKYISGPQKGTVLVSNGSTIWFYNETTKTARRLQLSDMKNGSLQQLTQVFKNLSSQYTVEYKGQATVSGRETYVVSVQPPEDGLLANITKNQTVWLDQENWFPIKHKISVQIANKTSTTLFKYTNISYNVSIPDEKFTFEPPEDAKVKNISLPDPKTYSSIEKAENAVNFSIKTPQVPDEYFVKGISVTKANGTTVTIIYQSGSETLVFTQSTADRPTTDGKEVSIDSFTGSYRTISGQGIIQWSDNKFSYSMTGSISKSSLIDAAESLYC